MYWIHCFVAVHHLNSKCGIQLSMRLGNEDPQRTSWTEHFWCSHKVQLNSPKQMEATLSFRPWDPKDAAAVAAATAATLVQKKWPISFITIRALAHLNSQLICMYFSLRRSCFTKQNLKWNENWYIEVDNAVQRKMEKVGSVKGNRCKFCIVLLIPRLDKFVAQQMEITNFNYNNHRWQPHTLAAGIGPKLK